MPDLSPRPERAASSARVAELHRLCDADFAKGQAERATARGPLPSYTASPPVTTVPESSDLDVAIHVAQQLLDSDSVISLIESARLLLRAMGAESDSAPALRETLRLLLRAVGAEPTPAPPVRRCPAAHPDDPEPCTGPPVVTVLDAHNAGADGCEHHGARLLASLDGGRVYPLPDAPAGAAIRVFKAAADTRPFAWVERGEGQ